MRDAAVRTGHSAATRSPHGSPTPHRHSSLTHHRTTWLVAAAVRPRRALALPCRARLYRLDDRTTRAMRAAPAGATVAPARATPVRRDAHDAPRGLAIA